MKNGVEIPSKKIANDVRISTPFFISFYFIRHNTELSVNASQARYFSVVWFSRAKIKLNLVICKYSFQPVKHFYFFHLFTA
jgi:hypothetical protein